MCARRDEHLGGFGNGGRPRAVVDDARAGPRAGPPAGGEPASAQGRADRAEAGREPRDGARGGGRRRVGAARPRGGAAGRGRGAGGGGPRPAAEALRAERLAEAVRERDGRLAEMSHRVKNDLRLVASLLRTQTAGRGTGQAAAALGLASARVEAVARVHGLLCHGDGSGAVAFERYLRETCTGLGEVFGVDGRRRALVVRAEAAGLPADMARSLGLVVDELVTNPFRHAFAADGPGTVWVELGRDAGGRLRLSVADDGAGPPEGSAAGGGPGLRLVTMTAAQLGAALAVGRQGGTQVTLTLPVASGGEGRARVSPPPGRPGDAAGCGGREAILPLLPRLRAYARVLARDPHAADDLAQDTVVLALRAWHRFTPGTNLEGWLLTIERNRFRSLRTRRHVTAEVGVDDLGPLASVPAFQEERAELRDFKAAFARLSAHHREALVLHVGPRPVLRAGRRGRRLRGRHRQEPDQPRPRRARGHAARRAADREAGRHAPAGPAESSRGAAPPMPPARRAACPAERRIAEGPEGLARLAEGIPALGEAEASPEVARRSFALLLACRRVLPAGDAGVTPSGAPVPGRGGFPHGSFVVRGSVAHRIGVIARLLPALGRLETCRAPAGTERSHVADHSAHHPGPFPRDLPGRRHRPACRRPGRRSGPSSPPCASPPATSPSVRALRADHLVRDTIVQALRDWDRRPAHLDLGTWLTGLLADRSPARVATPPSRSGAGCRRGARGGRATRFPGSGPGRRGRTGRGRGPRVPGAARARPARPRPRRSGPRPRPIPEGPRPTTSRAR